MRHANGYHHKRTLPGTDSITMPTFIALLLEHEHVEERGHLVGLVLFHALLQLHALVARHDRHLADALKTHTNRVRQAASKEPTHVTALLSCGALQ